MAMRIFQLLLVSALTLPALAQDSATKEPALKTKIAAPEVQLPVTVRDKHGVLVTSLTAADLTLTEDGHPEKITSLARETNPTFRLGLLVDTSRSLSNALESERKAAGKFVDTMLADEANAAPSKNQTFLIHFDREVELLRDFTNSREKLRRELDEMGPTHRSQDDAQGPETTGEDRDHTHGRGETQLYDAIFLASDELMKAQEGHKALVVFSDGVDRGSKDTLNDAVDAADRAGLEVYTIYFKGEEERGGGSGFPGTGGHHGGGYPGSGGGGYPGGGGRRPAGDSKKEEEDGRKTLEKIATRTGGRYFEAKKKENLEEIYTQIAEELRGQYLLTYTPDIVDKEGGFHKVVLKPNNDNYLVVTREGYYAPGGDSK